MYLFGKKSVNAIELLLNAGLEWNVLKIPLVAPVPVQFEDDVVTMEDVETGYVAIIREDNKNVLGVHKDGYEVFSNQQLGELLMQLSDNANLPIHSAGALKGGRKVYIQLKSDTLRLGNDKVNGFLTAVNSFDGSTSLGFGLSTVTVSCSNTFFMAYRQLDAKIKHTKTMLIKLDDIMRSYDVFCSEEKDHFEIIKKLASEPITQEMINAVYQGMFNTPFADIKAKLDTVSTRTLNNAEKLRIDLLDQVSSKGETMWGLFSGVTKYTTHTLKNEDSKMFGSIAKKERAIFSQFAKVVS